MEISLTPKLEEYIQQQVRSGLYKNPSEVVAVALQVISNISKMLNQTGNTNIGNFSTTTENLAEATYSPSKGIVKFMQRYISDPNFRTGMEKNPSTTLTKSGLDVSEGEIVLLSKIPINRLQKTLSNIPDITRLDIAMAAGHGLDLVSKEEFQPTPGVQKFMELYVSNPNFRNSFRSNPSQAVNTFGIQIKYDEVKQLAQLSIEKLEEGFSNIPNITRQNIVMAISDGIRINTAIEGWPSKDMQKCIEKYISDPAFRNSVAQNPKSSLKEAGFQISNEETSYLLGQNFEELEKLFPNIKRTDLTTIYDSFWEGIAEGALGIPVVPPVDPGTDAAAAAASGLFDAALPQAQTDAQPPKAADIMEALQRALADAQLQKAVDVAGAGSGGQGVGLAAKASYQASQIASTVASPIKTIYLGNPDKTWLLVVTNVTPGGS